MSKNKLIESIEKTAEKLLTQHELLDSPVRVDLLARRLGLNVEPAELGDDVSGVLVVNDGASMIGYNLHQSPVRQRFSIAHELGIIFYTKRRCSFL